MDNYVLQETERALGDNSLNGRRTVVVVTSEVYMVYLDWNEELFGLDKALSATDTEDCAGVRIAIRNCCLDIRLV